MATDVERWIYHLHQALPEAEFVSLEPEDGENALIAAVWPTGNGVYRILTHANTYYGKPEFVMDMEASSLDEASEWALAALQFSDDHRHLSDVVPGALFAGKVPHVDFAELNGWVIGLAITPDFFSADEAHLALYPIYASEVDLFKEVGLTTFLRKAGALIRNANRPALTR